MTKASMSQLSLDIVTLDNCDLYDIIKQDIGPIIAMHVTGGQHDLLKHNIVRFDHSDLFHLITESL